MVLPKGGSHYDQFVMLQKKEDRISKRTKKGKGQTTLAVEYPNVYRNRFIWSTNKLRGTLTEVPLQLTTTYELIEVSGFLVTSIID
jgi:hypothetical protein